jgi:hypothetical protein
MTRIGRRSCPAGAGRSSAAPCDRFKTRQAGGLRSTLHSTTGFGIALATLLLAALFTCVVPAQDSRPSETERLKALVDRRIEELRAELHREIDAALRDDSDFYGSMTLREIRELRCEIPAGLKLASVPASAEFHEVHGLFPGTARRVNAVDPGSQAERLGILAGDVLLGARDLSSVNPTVRVIRRNERLDPTRQPSESASQMVDRMWEEAVKKAVESDRDGLRIEKNVQESQPARK